MSEMPLNGICGGSRELAGLGGKEMFGSNFQVGLVGTCRGSVGLVPIWQSFFAASSWAGLFNIELTAVITSRLADLPRQAIC
jgi:hypothetical protein